MAVNRSTLCTSTVMLRERLTAIHSVTLCRIRKSFLPAESKCVICAGIGGHFALLDGGGGGVVQPGVRGGDGGGGGAGHGVAAGGPGSPDEGHFLASVHAQNQPDPYLCA